MPRFVIHYSQNVLSHFGLSILSYEARQICIIQKSRPLGLLFPLWLAKFLT